MVPIELSVKFTVIGLRPILGLPLKLAAGTKAPLPDTELVLLPPLLVIVTVLLKIPSLLGLNRIRTLVVPKPGRLKFVPDWMLNGLPPALATPFVIAAPPRFVRVKLSCALSPAATIPKFRLPGETANWAGVSPEPVTLLDELPPLLVNTTTLLKFPAVLG